MVVEKIYIDIGHVDRVEGVGEFRNLRDVIGTGERAREASTARV